MFSTPRSRSRVIRDAVTQSWSWSEIQNSTKGSCTSSPSGIKRYSKGSGSTQLVYEVETMDDVVTPDFKKLSGRGQIINNPLVKTHTTIDGVVGSNHYSFTQERYGCDPERWYSYTIQESDGDRDLIYESSEPYLPNPMSASQEEVVKELAITSAHARISRADVQSLVVAAEANKTVVGLIDVLKRVRRITKAIRKANLKMLKKEMSFQNLQDDYMQARYGLRPLYYDAKGIMNALKSKQLAQRQTFRGFHSATESDSNHDLMAVLKHSDTQGLDISSPLYRSVKCSFEARAGVLTSWNPNFDGAFGFDQIPESLWELIPFSFIVDWFTNCGDYVSSLAPNVGCKTLASWVTTTKEVYQSTTVGSPVITYWDGTLNGVRAANASASSSGSSHKYTKIVTREPNPSLPSLPNFTVNLDSLKIIDLGIILRNIRRNSSTSLRL